MSTELKPCPFCGSHPSINDNGDTVYVQCLKCDTDGPYFDESRQDAKERAENAWNTRTDPLRTSLTKLVEEWRQESAKGEGDNFSIGLESCAAQLEALLNQ